MFLTSIASVSIGLLRPRDTMRFAAPRSTSPSPVRRYVHTAMSPSRACSRTATGIPARHLACLPTLQKTRATSRTPTPLRPHLRTRSAMRQSPRYRRHLRKVVSRAWSPLSHHRNHSRRKSHLPIAEQHRLQDTVASIRLHVRHKDPYEEWEKDIRRDAFVRASTHLSVAITRRIRCVRPFFVQLVQRLVEDA